MWMAVALLWVVSGTVSQADQWIRVDIAAPHQTTEPDNYATTSTPKTHINSPMETITTQPQTTTPMVEQINNQRMHEKSKPKNVSADSITLTPSEMDTLVSVHKSLFLESQNDHSILGKWRFLEHLKNTIFYEMYTRIMQLFGGARATSRQARGDKGVEFPSNETALLTISFLLFAVYLIKLVQQLIRKLQGQNNSNANLVLVNPGRRRRSLPDLITTARVLKLMEDFKIHYNIQD